MTYDLNNTKTTLAELHSHLLTVESEIKGKSVANTTAPVLAIGQGKGKKRKGPPKQNWKGKTKAVSSEGHRANSGQNIPHVSNPKEAECFYCNEKGH